eukprot:GFUD01117829.1.p1 GENE.GFUD01117829.1~~GFUD01117829.1.p1  ORF type:complete len:131 (-),score=51.90 GFUD01117829.1:55-393(-)
MAEEVAMELKLDQIRGDYVSLVEKVKKENEQAAAKVEKKIKEEKHDFEDRPEVRNCPTCRQKIVGRAITVEKIAAQVFPVKDQTAPLLPPASDSSSEDSDSDSHFDSDSDSD